VTRTWLTSLVVVAATVRAAAADDATEAARLFDEAMQELANHHAEVACPKLSSSYKLHVDAVTESALADCLGQTGKIASAWRLWRDLIDHGPTPELRVAAADQAIKLEPRLPMLVLGVLPRESERVTLRVNGAALDWRFATAEHPYPIDPGPVQLDAAAPARLPWHGAYAASEGKKLAVSIPELAIDPASLPKAGPFVTRKRARYALGIGVALTGLGLVAGGGALLEWHRAEDTCGGKAGACDPLTGSAARSQSDRAHQLGAISTGGVAVGLASMATGLVMLLIVRARDEHALALRPTSGFTGIAIGGSL
jgi:hypothetical protein